MGLARSSSWRPAFCYSSMSGSAADFVVADEEVSSPQCRSLVQVEERGL